MKATEFRIGNLVLWQNEIACIAQILELEVVFKCGDIGFIKDCQPIQITKDWLLKLGFEETEFCFRLGTFFLTKSKQAERFFYQDYKNRFIVMHVHQLQNLYFALYEEELIFNN